ncbi:hypothetical protein ACTVJH_12660 [Desulfoplanes sp. PS50]
MLNYLRNKWAQLSALRAKRREIAPESFTVLTTEILELAQLVEKIRPGDHDLGVKLSRLEQEIKHLQVLVEKRSFKKLSCEKRMELKKNLIFSRQQLLEAMGAASPPTERIQ